jgi:hypothetical protein
MAQAAPRPQTQTIPTPSASAETTARPAPVYTDYASI